MKKRVFIGISLPIKIKDYLFEIERQLQKLPIKCKFVPKKNLHITLKFIPEAEENDIEIIKEKLKEIKLSKFKCILTNLDFFPKKDKARVIWIGLDNKEELFNLQREIDSSLLGFVNTDKQEFKSHITLGRIKFIKNKETFSKEVSQIKIENLEFEVDSFSLFESKLTKDGSFYKIIENYEI